jgi:hypothetical protein
MLWDGRGSTQQVEKCLFERHTRKSPFVGHMGNCGNSKDGSRQTEHLGTRNFYLSSRRARVYH